MNATQSAGFEHAVMALYIHNVVVALPLTILLVKLLVRFVTREAAKDIFRSVLVVPLDLIYVAFGLLLAGMARRLPAFVAHYHSDKETDFAGIVLCLILFVSACFVTWIDRLVRLLWQKFFAAWNLTRNMQNDGPLLVGPPAITRIGVIYFWIFTYWVMMIPCVLLEAIISVEALGGILKRLQ
jgi:hypothetical protein